MTGSLSNRLTKELRKEMSSAAPGFDGYDTAKIGIYTKGTAQMFFIGFPGTADNQLTRELADSPSRAVVAGRRVERA